MVVRGAHFFAPYQRLSLRARWRPSLSQPARPFPRNDPDHIRQVAPAFATALLDRHKPKPSRLANGVLNHPSADTRPRCKLVHAPGAMPMLANLIADDA